MKRNLIQFTAVASFVSAIALGLVFGLSTVSKASETSKASHTLATHSRQRPCSERTLKGRYAAFGSGTLALAGVGPISFVGLGDFDGNGAVAGSDTASIGGQIFRRSYSGTYEVNENCTGSLTFVLPPPRNFEVHFDFVIVDGGEQAFLIQTDPGTDLRVEMKRQ